MTMVSLEPITVVDSTTSGVTGGLGQIDGESFGSWSLLGSGISSKLIDIFWTSADLFYVNLARCPFSALNLIAEPIPVMPSLNLFSLTMVRSYRNRSRWYMWSHSYRQEYLLRHPYQASFDDKSLYSFDRAKGRVFNGSICLDRYLLLPSFGREHQTLHYAVRQIQGLSFDWRMPQNYLKLLSIVRMMSQDHTNSGH